MLCNAIHARETVLNYHSSEFHNACSRLTVYAQQSSHLYIYVFGGRALDYSTIYCPDTKGKDKYEKSCVIEVEEIRRDGFVNKLTNTQIYSKEGFKHMSLSCAWSDAPPSNATDERGCNNWGTITSPVLYCGADNEYSCTLTSSDGHFWWCAFPSACSTWQYTTQNPTINPTMEPTMEPTIDPTANPTTSHPTIDPTNDPTLNPTMFPTNYPSINPSISPTDSTSSPTSDPTKNDDDAANSLFSEASGAGFHVAALYAILGILFIVIVIMCIILLKMQKRIKSVENVGINQNASLKAQEFQVEMSRLNQQAQNDGINELPAINPYHNAVASASVQELQRLNEHHNNNNNNDNKNENENSHTDEMYENKNGENNAIRPVVSPGEGRKETVDL